jgi:hypothetical protein
MAAVLAACLTAGVLALVLAACGSDSPEATANAKTTPISAPADGVPASAPKPKATPASRCVSQLDGFLKTMDTLRTNLVAGLAYEQYVGGVKKAIAAYDAVPVEELTLGCVQAAGTPGEKALNRYIAASNTWTDCVEVPSCEAISVEAPLQSQWREASNYLSKAQRGLTSPSAS